MFFAPERGYVRRKRTDRVFFLTRAENVEYLDCCSLVPPSTFLAEGPSQETRHCFTGIHGTDAVLPPVGTQAAPTCVFSPQPYLFFRALQMFRNEVMDTVPQNLTVEWFVKLPRRGIIRYLSTPQTRSRDKFPCCLQAVLAYRAPVARPPV